MPSDELYRRFGARVLRLCRALLADPHEADDVAQEVFEKVLRRGDREVDAWEAWLDRVTVNACRDRRRSGWWRLWRRSSDELDETRLAHASATPEYRLLADERRDALWAALRALPVRQREAFALRILEGRSTEEAAAALGISTGSVKRHLFRAVSRLRQEMGGGS